MVPRMPIHSHWVSSSRPVRYSGKAPRRKRRGAGPAQASPTSSRFAAACSHRSLPIADTKTAWPTATTVMSHGNVFEPVLSGEREVISVVVEAEVGDGLFTGDGAQRVLHLGQLDEEIMLRLEAGLRHRALEVEREPLLDALPLQALGQVEEQG